ncbi:MAG: DUF1028 domain-containing protein [Gemmatimonadetes bacterium]|nr:DUF1028 domain-containing protein [Gemmatimonadota bacterium]MYE16209.1 DUF1028 domain-containing protein [Gemmatimonadota bacterium]
MRRTTGTALPLLPLAAWALPLGAQERAATPLDTEEEIVATFSIVARDPATGELGVAVQSRAFRAGAIVSYAKAGVGAIATQAAANQTYGPRGLELLELGLSPDEVVEHLTGSDPGRDRRQLAVIDARGQVRAYTGSGTSAWAGHIEGENYSVQGNILAGEAVVQAMAAAFESSRGALALRLMDALDAGEAAGGDARGKQAGGVLVVKPIGDSGRTTDRWVDVRVDDHTEPFRELRRLVNMSVSRIHASEARSLAAEGSFSEAIEKQREAIAIVPDEDQMIYGLARLHARAGDVANAVATLRDAIERNARWRELAATQRDFDGIRDDPEFRRLVGG